MGKSKILRNYIYNTSYQIMLILTPLITSPYIARVLGDTSNGIVNYAYSIVTYFVLVGTVGSSLYGQREVAYYQNNPEKRSSVLKEILIFRIIMVGISTCVYCLTVISNGRYPVVYTFMLAELIAAAFDVAWFFQGMEDFKKTVIRNIIVKIIGTALIFILLKSPEDINKYAFCLTVPTLLGNLSLWTYLPQYVVKSSVSVKRIVKNIRPMLILFLPQIATEVNSILDKSMIGMLSPHIEEVAYYNYAQHIVKALLQLMTSLGVVMLPAMANAFANKQNEKIIKMMSNSFKFIFMLGVPIMFGIAAVANNMVSWFYGPGYEAVGPLMMVLAPLVCLVGLSTTLGKQYLLPTKRQTEFTISIILGTVTNFVLNYILIPRYDAMGAAVATIIAEAIVVLVQLLCLRRQLPLGTYFKDNVKYILYGLVMFVPVFMLNEYISGIVGTVVQVVIGAVIYLALLLVTKDEFIFEFFGKVFKRNKNN